jgi:hypothetical protein
MLPCGRTAGGTAIGCGAARACAIVAALLAVAAVAAVAPAAGARADGLPGLTCAAYTRCSRVARDTRRRTASREGRRAERGNTPAPLAARARWRSSG